MFEFESGQKLSIKSLVSDILKFWLTVGLWEVHVFIFLTQDKIDTVREYVTLKIWAIKKCETLPVGSGKKKVNLILFICLSRSLCACIWF